MSAEPSAMLEAGGYTYVLRHADALDTLQVCARLGNASAALFDGLAHGKGAARLANAAVFLLSSPALGPTLDFVVRTFAPHTTVRGPSGVDAKLSDCIGAHFAGRMSDFAKWIEAAVEFECGDFLGEMAEKFAVSLAEAVKEASASPSPKPAGTTG